MDRKQGMVRKGVKEFLAKYGAATFTGARLVYDMVTSWFGHHHG